MKPDIVSQLDIFFSRYPEYSKEKGTTLIHAGDAPPGIIYLTSGIVREYAITRKGEEVTVNLFKPFAYFPMSLILNETKNRYYFVAITPVSYRLAPGADVIQYISRKPEILLDLLSRVYRGTDGLLLRLEYALTGSATMKVVYTILNAAYRFGEPTPGGTRIPLRITHKDLATLSGTSRETFSREIKKLENENLITIQEGCIIVNNLEKLEEMLLGV
ncbi:MAG: Crp/Fnr family transcriptional regulator [Patescibacteria group bacterium]|nr:Crp/Fnr family transcriptional regulator [Patescibacteria group bacterium]